MRDPIRWYVEVDHVEFIGQEWPVVIVRRWQEDADGQRVLIAERAFDLNAFSGLTPPTRPLPPGDRDSADAP